MAIETPSSAYTFRDLVLRVAEYLGVAYYGANGDEEAQVPQDKHDLDVCKRLVNDGLKMFVQDRPNWRWAERIFRLKLDSSGDGPFNVNGDPARYIMPRDFGGDASADWTFDEESNVPPIIETVPEHFIRRQRSIGANESGEPYWAAFRRLSPEHSPSDGLPRWEVIFYPEPGSDYTVVYRYRYMFQKLIELDQDQQPAGPEFDEAVLSAALAKAELLRDDAAGAMWKIYQRNLQQAYRLDDKAAPTTLGYNDDATAREYVYNRSQFGFDRPTQRVTYRTSE